MTRGRYDNRFVWQILPLLALAGGARAADTGPQSREFFEARIRPVLVTHCARCHGAGPKVKGGLRVNSRAGLLKGGDSGPALVPGDPFKSRLVDAIRYKNVDLQMPPKGKLPNAVIADLTNWVHAGAVWPDDGAGAVAAPAAFDVARRKAEHWCWRPVARPEVPPVKDRTWPRGPVDAFVLARLESNHLSPAAPAEKLTLLRRLTFDLTGLPPTPDEIRAFREDRSPDAYEKVVDRLLASPAYGERWARHWLDLVRYADTRGHEFDYPIPNAWQYRDYVVRALNADVPYDRFVVEQVAGDLLPEPRRHPADGFNESVLGTGFWLLGEEVHSPVDVRQDLADRLDNRIDVFSKTFLGLTMACARCHDHKFDAISSKDYYALFGILEGASPRLVRFDTLEQNRQVASDLARARAAARPRLEKALAADAAPALHRAADYLLAARQCILTKQPGAVAAGRVKEIAAGHRLSARLLAAWLAAIEAAEPDGADPLHAWAVAACATGASEPSHFAASLRAVAAAARRRASSPKDDGAETRFDFATAAGDTWLPDESAFGAGPELPGSARVTGLPVPAVTFAEEGAATYDRTCDAMRVAAGAEGEQAALGHRARPGRTIRTPAFTLTSGRLFYRVKGSGTAYAAVEGHGLISGPLHGALVIEFKGADGFRWVMHDLTAYRGRRTHVEFTPAAASDFAISKVVESPREPPDPRPAIVSLERLLSGNGATSPEGLAAAYEHLFQELCSELSEDRPPADPAVRARLANWLLRRPGLLHGDNLREAAEEAAAQEAEIAAALRPESRLAPALLEGGGADERVFLRGSYKTPGERVPRRFLEALAGPAPLPGRPRENRLALARQLTDPSLTPLTARVQVNRVWHHLFGRGIVASTDNFGVLGDRPTHPELLDWLADEFVRRGWSVKALIRTLVLSSTYRMDSRADPAADAADPQDLLLHRMRMRRLEGEAIRDAVLAVSGRLDPRLFGRPVPIHLTPFLDGRGRPTSGPVDGEGRRSLYLAVRRNFLSPFLLAFDTPIPFSTVGRRSVSTVPAQALILLNDPFVHEQSAVWARLVLSETGSPGSRIEGMYLRALGRSPAEGEREACLRFLRQQAEARGTTVDDPGPWADLAHTLINVKEFIFVR